jgi:membrane protease YdiL (CAAX protease family)
MKTLFPSIHFDWKVTTVTIASTLLLMVDYYHQLTGYKPLDRMILYFIVPFLVILLVFRENPGAYGFTWGDWKAGLVITLGGIALMTPIIWYLGSSDPSMSKYYAPLLNGPIPLPLITFLELFGWEFFFRGWVLFSYERKFGPEALWLQAVPFALAHLSKPEVETLSTIFGGFAFGWVAWRTKSFLYPFIIHWYIFTLVALVAGGAFG